MLPKRRTPCQGNTEQVHGTGLWGKAGRSAKRQARATPGLDGLRPSRQVRWRTPDALLAIAGSPREDHEKSGTTVTLRSGVTCRDRFLQPDKVFQFDAGKIETGKEGIACEGGSQRAQVPDPMGHVVRSVDETVFKIGCEFDDITRAQTPGEQIVRQFRTVFTYAFCEKCLHLQQAFQVDAILGKHGASIDVAAKKAAHR